MLENVLLISYKNYIRNGECKTKDFNPNSRYSALLRLYIQQNRVKSYATTVIFRDNKILKQQ